MRLAKEHVKLNKPIYIGQAVLELSKLEMYELRYHHLTQYEQLFNGQIRIAGGDTDSFFLCVDGIDVNAQLLPQMLKDGLLDSSNYPTSHPLYSTACKAKLGCIKDEAEGHAFMEWVLLKPKCYSMKAYTGKDKRRAKGVRRFTLAHAICHDDYLKAFQDQVSFAHLQRRIGSERHQNYTLQYEKQTLTFWEDKRAWVEENVSVPYGNHGLTSERRPPLKRTAPTHAPECLQPAAKKPRLD